MADQIETPTPIVRLGRDLRAAAANLSEQEVRYLVDAYYIMQENRIRAGGQIRAMDDSEEPHFVLDWLYNQNFALEEDIKKALDAYTKHHAVGTWLRGVHGIGPVIAAGLLAHIDIERAPTAGHIWSFAGLYPGIEWKKGQKRPFNMRLKTLAAYKAGESFVKQSTNKKCFYGHLYKERKEKETAINESGGFAQQAAEALEKRNYSKTTDAYKWYTGEKSGKPMLPPAHIHARARRYAVKIFLAHLHHVMYVTHFGKLPPNPYPIEHMGHAHIIEVPGFPTND